MNRVLSWYIGPYLVAPILLLTGWRFDKTWRWAESGPKAWFYRVCCTFHANMIVDGWKS